MTPQENTITAKPAILTQSLKQSQKVLDLSTGDEDATISVLQTKYFAPAYDAKYGTEAEFEEALFLAAAELIQPKSKQIEALLYRATQDSYQAGKIAAMATGNYLTSDLKAKIVQVMRGNQAFVDLSAKECYERWKSGYMGARGDGPKAGATKVLATAKDLGDGTDEL